MYLLHQGHSSWASPKQRYQLGTKSWNARACGDILIQSSTCSELITGFSTISAVAYATKYLQWDSTDALGNPEEAQVTIMVYFW